MKISVRGKNIEVTPALEDYVEKKIGKLAKFFEEDVESQVVLSVTRGDHLVEATVFLSGLILRAEEATDDMYSSIDLVVEKLEKQIHKYKTRLNRRLRQTSLKELNERYKDDQREEEEKRVVRTKRFAVKPMPVEEAVLQMDLLGHDFFVFANAETEDVNVVYRRKDGNYGLIEPEH